MGALVLAVLDALAWTVLSTLLLLLGLQLVSAVMPSVARELMIAGCVEVAAFTFVSLWLVRDARSGTGAARALGLGRAPAGLLAIGVALGVCLHGPADALEWLGRKIWPVEAAELVERARRLAPASRGQRAAVFAVAAVLAPFVEELLFRGALFRRLRAHVPLMSTVAITAVCFSLSHLEPRIWPALVIVGLALGALRALGYGLWPCFLLHAAFNATTLLVAFGHPTTEAEIVSAVPSLPVVLTGTVVSGALLLVALRRYGAAMPERP